ncbi:MAG: hypothetical protein AAB920_01565 [Patescibacteria group bacterium]
MDQAKVREVLALYRKKFEEFNIPHDEYSNEYPKWIIPDGGRTEEIMFGTPHFHFLAHCESMLDQMEVFIQEDKMDEVFRWLGFIQGVLWQCGIYTVGEMANHNRPPK